MKILIVKLKSQDNLPSHYTLLQVVFLEFQLPMLTGIRKPCSTQSYPCSIILTAVTLIIPNLVYNLDSISTIIYVYINVKHI